MGSWQWVETPGNPCVSLMSRRVSPPRERYWLVQHQSTHGLFSGRLGPYGIEVCDEDERAGNLRGMSKHNGPQMGRTWGGIAWNRGQGMVYIHRDTFFSENHHD